MRIELGTGAAYVISGGGDSSVALTPHVLRCFANAGYGDFDYVPSLGRVRRPMLVIVGEHARRPRRAPRACSTKAFRPPSTSSSRGPAI